MIILASKIKLFSIILSLVTLTNLAYSQHRLEVNNNDHLGIEDLKHKKLKSEISLGSATCDSGQPIDVEATTGLTQAGYATLGGAFTAINTGVHSGVINIEICTDVDEGTTPATLNSSGAGSASYTSVNIYPLADDVSIIGNPGSGFGVVQLNGADNIIIDGDNPNTEGVNQNLKIENVNSATTSYSFVVRVAVSSALLTADDISIQNTVLNGNATGRNISSIIGNTTSANTTGGIYIAGGGGATATSAPVGLTSVTSSGMPASSTVNNVIIENNRINGCGRGVVFFGTLSTHSNSILISKNVIGSPTEGDITGVYSKGVAINGGSGVVIQGNSIFVESYLSASISGIELGIGNAGTFSTHLIEKNIISRVKNNRPSSTGAYGISLDRGSGHIVLNNFVSGVINSQISSGGNFELTNSAVGIRVAEGNLHQVLHNSVHLYGTILGTAGFNLTTALGIRTTTQSGMDVRNNIFSNQISGGSVGETFHTVLTLPSGTTSLNLHLNNNAYYQGVSVNSRLARRGFSLDIDPTTEFYAANFNSASTTPASNLRSYTSGLRSGGANDNASFASTVAPPFVSDSDLHLFNAQGTFLNNNGISTTVGDDIDSQIRGTIPDIGADEIMPPTSAIVGISGRVITADGRGIAGAVMTIEGGSLEQPKTLITNPFGYYRFDGLEAGQTYILTVGSKRYLFSKPSRVIELLDNINDFNIVAEP